MLKIEHSKKIVRGIVGLSTYWTFKNIVENNITPANRKQRIQGRIGAAAFGATVAEQTSEYSDKWVEDAYKALEKWHIITKRVQIKINDLPDTETDAQTDAETVIPVPAPKWESFTDNPSGYEPNSY